MVGFVVGIGVAVVAAFVNYWLRLREQRRQRQVQAYLDLLVAFRDAAWTGSELLSVHTQTGPPYKLDRETWGAEAAAQMARAHAEAFASAASARRRFETAAYGVEMVGSDAFVEMGHDLRTFLVGALYSGSPWSGEYNYPTASLNPVDIDGAADRAAAPVVTRARAELYGYRHERGWRGLWRSATRWWPGRNASSA